MRRFIDTYDPHSPESAGRYLAARILEAAVDELDRAEAHDRGGFTLTAGKADGTARRLIDAASRLIDADNPADKLARIIDNLDRLAARERAGRYWHAADEIQTTAERLKAAGRHPLAAELLEEVTP